MVMFLIRTRMKKWSHQLLGFEFGSVKKTLKMKKKENIRNNKWQINVSINKFKIKNQPSKKVLLTKKKKKVYQW